MSYTNKKTLIDLHEIYIMATLAFNELSTEDLINNSFFKWDRMTFMEISSISQDHEQLVTLTKPENNKYH